MTNDGAGNRATVEAVEARRGLGDYARGKNVDDVERVMSVIGGTALALWGLSRFSLTRLAVAAFGANLVYRGITGHCRLYARLGVSTDDSESVRGNRRTKVRRAIIVYAPQDRVFRFWRNFANLPRFMKNLEEVRVLYDRRSHWVGR